MFRMAAALALLAGALNGADFAVQRKEVLALGRLTAAPAVYEAPGFTGAPGERALYFEGVPYRGKPTRVFAWYGEPKSRTGKAPGIVLVHGGGGTAFREWVRKWNEHGFAAISIAVEGQTDERVTKSNWKRHEWGGPARGGIYADSEEPLADQWMYHAVAATVLANSLLRSFPNVDAGKIGVMGISWGGVITSTVIGIDSRFAFAIPTYGCGAMADVDNQWGKALGGSRHYREVWDPVQYLPRARMPVLWLTWLYDNHFPLSAQRASYLAAKGPRMVAVVPDMKHSHPAGWNPPDSYAFAEAVVSSGRPWLREVATRFEQGTASAEFLTQRPIESAVLFFTGGTGYTGRRDWSQTPAAIETRGGRLRVSASLPLGARAWFFHLRSGALTASSSFSGE